MLGSKTKKLFMKSLILKFHVTRQQHLSTEPRVVVLADEAGELTTEETIDYTPHDLRGVEPAEDLTDVDGGVGGHVAQRSYCCR